MRLRLMQSEEERIMTLSLDVVTDKGSRVQSQVRRLPTPFATICDRALVAALNAAYLFLLAISCLP
jgi:hypothetical protein